MLVAVISDLHLGSGDQTDAFGHDDYEFLRFLRFLERNFERIILLGDIWETLTARSFGSEFRELTRAREQHRELYEQFQRSQYRYVHGNHDLIAARADRAPAEYALEANGVKLLFSHGHQGDKICSHARYISELGVWAGGWLKRVGLDPVYSYFAHVEANRDARPEKCAVRRWAVGEAVYRAADVVVTGHTHILARAEEGPCLFLNSGSCAEGQLSFLSLDTKVGTYGTHTQY